MAKLSWQARKPACPDAQNAAAGSVHVDPRWQWGKPRSNPPRPCSAPSVPHNSLSSIIPTAALRSRLARKAEDLKEQWLRSLRLADEWKSPIIIQVLPLRRPDSPRIRTGLYESDGGALKVQIDVCDAASLRSADFHMEVYRALFLEYAYRNLPPKAGKSFHQPPAWLIEGLYEDAVARNEGIATGVYEQLIKEESPPKLDSILERAS